MSFFSGKTLRSRFGWRAFAFSLLIVGTTAIGSGLYWQSRLLSAIGTGLANHIDSIESELQLDLDAGNNPFSENRVLVLPTPETGVLISDGDGETLAASAQLVGREPIIPLSSVPQSGTLVTSTITDSELGHVLVKARTLDLGASEYVIQAITSLGDVDRARRLIWLVFPLASLLVAGLIGAGVAASVTYALRPVRSLAHRAGEISAGRRPMKLDVSAPTIELQDLAAQLDHLLDVIRAAFDREQAFLDDASHELRTPIAIARAELDLARRSTPDADTRSALDSAIDELDELHAKASDLLVLARSRSGGSQNFSETELQDVVAHAAALVGRDPRQPELTLDISGNASVVADAAALERAFANLIANAGRYGAHRVTVAIQSCQEKIEIAFADDGPGIPDHLLDNLFDRFTRGESRAARSTGLGTAIAAEIVRNHGGTIRAFNNESGGATVVISLPQTPMPTPGPTAGPVAADRS
jgi:two-component system OmpR family sensor kinase